MPNPTLNGSCAWDTKNNTFGGGVSAKVTTAPTIKDQYGRTCEGPFFAVNGTKVGTTVSGGLTVNQWNSSTPTQTMSGITISATCGGTTLTPPISCPDITVKNPDAMCEYVPSYCGGLAIEKVKTDATVGASGGGNVAIANGGTSEDKTIGKCFYVTSITVLGNTPKATVNGSNLPGNGQCGMNGQNGTENWSQSACSSVLPETVDNGYYVFFPGQDNPVAGYWDAQKVYMTNSGGSLNANCR